MSDKATHDVDDLYIKGDVSGIGTTRNFIAKAKIQSAIKPMAAAIDDWIISRFHEQQSQLKDRRVLLVIVNKGGGMFANDLQEELFELSERRRISPIKDELRYDVASVDIYVRSRDEVVEARGTPLVSWEPHIEHELTRIGFNSDWIVVIVDDIYETGRTIDLVKTEVCRLFHRVSQLQERDLLRKICTVAFCWKRVYSKTAHKKGLLNIYGYMISDVWVCGYGMDGIGFDGLLRSRRGIGYAMRKVKDQAPPIAIRFDGDMEEAARSFQMQPQRLTEIMNWRASKSSANPIECPH